MTFLIVDYTDPSAVAPNIDSLMRGCTIPDHIRIRANVSGQPTPTVTWYHNKSPLQENCSEGIKQSYENGSATLIHPLMDSCTGDNEFTLEAINHMGKAISRITCSAPNSRSHPDAPQILTPLATQIVKTNSTLELAISFTGSPLPVIKWTRNGQVLETAHSVKIVTCHTGESTLTIQMMERNKGGKFEVSATNKYGEARSSASILVCDLKESPDIVPPRFITPLQPKLVGLGEVVILEALIQSTPNCVFQWTSSGKLVKLSNDIRIVSHDNKSILIIRKFKREHEGTYTCRAENVGGSVTSTATLRLRTHNIEPTQKYFSPRFTYQLEPIQIYPCAQSMVLQCELVASPQSSVVWQKDGVQIQENERVSISQNGAGTCTLRIAEVNQEDSGEYTCLANNEYGHAISISQVLVEGI